MWDILKTLSSLSPHSLLLSLLLSVLLSPRFRKIAAQDDKLFCKDCQLLLLTEEHLAHGAHKIIRVNVSQLRRPTALLRPLENKKSNAQYLFTDRSSHFLLDAVAALGYRKVLCVGTPR